MTTVIVAIACLDNKHTVYLCGRKKKGKKQRGKKNGMDNIHCWSAKLSVHRHVMYRCVCYFPTHLFPGLSFFFVGLAGPSF